MKAKRNIQVPFFWWIISMIIITGLVYLLTKDGVITLMVGLSDLGIKGLIYSVYLARWKKKQHREPQPAVIWFTGLPGSGKTTLGNAVAKALKERGATVERLDGDMIRDIFPGTGFSPEDRDRHIRRVGYLAGRLEAYGVAVVASFISPYRESRRFARSQCRRFIEVYLSTPLEVCEKRDPNGLYSRARKGEIPHFTGVNDPYEAPEHPEIRIDTSDMDVSECVSLILSYLDNTAGKTEESEA